MTDEAFFTCPSCWERISMLIDCSVRKQTYIEDCEVCCRPLKIKVRCSKGKVDDIEAELQ